MEAEYPNHSDDPEPPPSNSTKTTIQAYHKELKEYTTSVYQAYNRSKMRGETLWCDFITTFRPVKLRSWPKPTLIEWVDILIMRGIYIIPDLGTSATEKLIDLLYREYHIGVHLHRQGAGDPTNDKEDTNSERTKKESKNPKKTPEGPSQDRGKLPRRTAGTQVQGPSTT